MANLDIHVNTNDSGNGVIECTSMICTDFNCMRVVVKTTKEEAIQLGFENVEELVEKAIRVLVNKTSIEELQNFTLSDVRRKYPDFDTSLKQ